MTILRRVNDFGYLSLSSLLIMVDSEGILIFECFGFFFSSNFLVIFEWNKYDILFSN